MYKAQYPQNLQTTQYAQGGIAPYSNYQAPRKSQTKLQNMGQNQQDIDYYGDFSAKKKKGAQMGEDEDGGDKKFQRSQQKKQTQNLQQQISNSQIQQKLQKYAQPTMMPQPVQAGGLTAFGNKYDFNVKVEQKNPNSKIKINSQSDQVDDLLLKFSHLTDEQCVAKCQVGAQLFSNSMGIDEKKQETQQTYQQAGSQQWQQKKQMAMKQGGKYEDREFQPGRKTLYGTNIDLENGCGGMKGIDWKRPEDFMGNNFELFLGSIEPNDICQGELGDCYFLCSISAIAEKDFRIKKLFVDQKKCQQGIYCVKICNQGIWEEVIIDDRIPCRGKIPLYSRGNGNELWVLLLEKAWAKLYGSYGQIEAGLTREALHDLTGAPYAILWNSDENQDKVWKAILNAEKKDFIMTSGTKNQDDLEEDLESKGLMEGHAYSMLSAVELTYEEKGKRKVERLVKMRNPWGEGEWKSGHWSDNDPRWNLISQQQKDQIGFGGSKDDGIFFLDFETYMHYYDAVQICYYHQNFQYNSIKCTTAPKKPKFFIAELDKSGQYYFSVSQKSIRFYPEDVQDDFEYSMVKLTIADSNKVIVDYTKNNERDVTSGYVDEGELKQIFFQKGTYYIKVEINWNEGKKHDFGLACYGEGNCKLTKVKKNQLGEFTKGVSSMAGENKNVGQGQSQQQQQSQQSPQQFSGYGQQQAYQGFGQQQGNKYY